MKLKKIHWMVVLLLIGETACNEEDVIPETDDRILLEITAGYPVQTRATDAGFADGDRIGIYVTDYTGSTAKPLEEARVANMPFTFDEGGDAWNGTQPIYFKNASTPADVTGYYPYNSTADDPRAYPFSVAERQDTPADGSTPGGYESSDLLWAKAEKASAGSGRVQLTFRHLMAGVTVELEKGEGFSDEEWTSAKKHAYVSNALTSCSVDLANGSVTATGEQRADILPIEYAGSFRAVIVPQSYDAGTELIGIDIDGTAYSLTKKELTTFASGKMHRFRIRVDKRTESGTYQLTLTGESVSQWVDDPDFHDGIVRSYTTVTVNAPDTFTQTLAGMGKDYRTVQSLKVMGPLSEEDIMFIGDMPILLNLNLKEATLANDRIPEEAFRGSTLMHIVFPNQLKEIKKYAFYETPLTGTLVLPEGLENIGEYSFANNSSSYSIVWPSSLKRIESFAFEFNGGRNGLKGSLILPNQLEYIGEGAFRQTNLSGSLVLPESITYLGRNAFADNGIKGNLTIPASLKNVYSDTFYGCQFDGYLILSEGLESIGAYAFCHTRFKGSLVLPASLHEIGDNAFKETGFSEVVLPENLKYLGAETFLDCESLTGHITFPKSITSIPANCFRNTKITEVTLHKDINYIKEGAFAENPYLTIIHCENPTPPTLQASVFDKVPKNNVTVDVPKNALQAYRQDLHWKEFPRLAEYKNFVCLPSLASALGSGMRKEIVLNADNAWKVTHLPEWATLSSMEGTGKTALVLNIQPLTGATQRADSIVFSMEGSDATTLCRLTQYGYEHAEDALVPLQRHSKGNGIGIYFVGDGWTAEQISRGDYLALCREEMEYFFGLPPYDRLRDCFDVYAAVALSQDSGINTPSTYRDTRLGTIWSVDCLTGTGRLVADTRTVVSYVSGLTGKNEEDLSRSLIILIPNTTDYPGITYYYNKNFLGAEVAISICPPSNQLYPNDTRGTVQHEAGGHGFAKLADETVTKNTFPKKEVLNEINEYKWRGWYANISTSGKMNDVDWSTLIFDPRYSNYVDIFEGGYGYTRSVYRSEANSCMNYGIPYYNAISRLEISRRVMEASGIGFDIERDFFSVDTREWGNTTETRSLSGSELKPIPGHHAPMMVTQEDYQNAIKQQKR